MKIKRNQLFIVGIIALIVVLFLGGIGTQSAITGVSFTNVQPSATQINQNQKFNVEAEFEFPSTFFGDYIVEAYARPRDSTQAALPFGFNRDNIYGNCDLELGTTNQRTKYFKNGLVSDFPITTNVINFVWDEDELPEGTYDILFTVYQINEDVSNLAGNGFRNACLYVRENFQETRTNIYETSTGVTLEVVDRDVTEFGCTTYELIGNTVSAAEAQLYFCNVAESTPDGFDCVSYSSLVDQGININPSAVSYLNSILEFFVGEPDELTTQGICLESDPVQNFQRILVENVYIIMIGLGILTLLVFLRRR